MKKIGFVIKHLDIHAASFASELAKFVYSSGSKPFFDITSRKIAEKLSKELKTRIPLLKKEDMPGSTDFIVVLGGDGTLLSIARMMKNKSIPIMGINMGQLGFLTEIKQTEAIETIRGMLAGNLPPISKRSMLNVMLKRDKEKIIRCPVINDVVVAKGAIARIINIQVSVNGKWVHDVRADGLIVSTPTGSTAYSLAAGGPIIEPPLSAIVMTPICPHTLTQRPLVLSDNAIIEIRVKEPRHVLLTLDGQDAIEMREKDVVIVQKFKKHPLKLVSSPTRDYFSLLREKLKFGIRN
ncbi:MAG: NAD(+)/NADH kinase [Candidatus Poribacteria bacterium]